MNSFLPVNDDNNTYIFNYENTGTLIIVMKEWLWYLRWFGESGLT